MNEYNNNQYTAKKKGVSVGAVIAICLVFSILAALLGAGGTYLFMRNRTTDDDGLITRAPVLAEPEVTEEPMPEEEAVAEDEPIVAAGAVDETASHIYYDLALHQVVGVTTEISYTNIFGQVSASSVTGSGFIFNTDGYIMTNYHVIEEAVQGGYEVSVLMHDETEYTAEIVGYDSANDVAVLKIEAENLSAAVLGDTESLAVGQVVYAVGNPLGELNYTMTRGIVSATDRAITTENSSVPVNMFQIDAAVNSGNSGGPVYNADGQVVGIVTAKTSATGVEGLGFAIPIADAAHIADQIMEYGYVKDRATLGVTAETIPASIAERYNMVVGAYVRSVVEGGAAEAAGIQVGDIITALGGEAVEGSTELTAMVREHAVGEEVELTLWRSGEELTVTTTLGESQPPVVATPMPQQQAPQQGQYPYGYYSYGYGDMDDFFRQFFGGFGF